jgi:hypothetical protein
MQTPKKSANPSVIVYLLGSLPSASVGKLLKLANGVKGVGEEVGQGEHYLADSNFGKGPHQTTRIDPGVQVTEEVIYTNVNSTGGDRTQDRDEVPAVEVQQASCK